MKQCSGKTSAGQSHGPLVASQDGRLWCTFEKRIDDGEAADAAAVLHVFAEQRVATTLDGGGDDQGVVERQAVLAGEGHGAGVRVQRDGQDVIERRAEQPEREFDLRPVMMKLAAGA